jgi:hypothetical protein
MTVTHHPLDRMLAAILITGTLAACGAAPAPSASPDPSPSGTPTQSVPPTPSTPISSASISVSPSPTGTAAPRPPDGLGPFGCSYPVIGAGTVKRAQMTDVRVGVHTGYDRIVFEFAHGIPAYRIRPVEPPLTRDPSGLPLAVAGDSFLSIVLDGGTKVTPDGGQTYRGDTDFMVGSAALVELVEAGDFEAVSSWYAGLHGDRCIRVLTLSGPSRLVIDVEQ